jgi:BirA family transcriptional regulator, biotin operon repressor / biotin---[acetyl-CoA-carboxylase] ligase
MTFPVEHLDQIDSTNTEAMRRIAKGETGPLWLIARTQTAGRGRSGRSWTSEAGNFYGSLILPLDCSREAAAQMSLIVGVAVVDALTEVVGRPIPGLRLKWPNDVLLGTAKLAGILTESTLEANSGRLIVVPGIGINLTNPPRSLGRATAALACDVLASKASGDDVLSRPGHLLPPDLTPAALVAPLSHWLQHWLRLWSAGETFAVVKDAWQTRAGRLGEAITVNTGSGPAAGTYQGLDGDGALLMRLEDGTERRVTFGDVMLAREQTTTG